MALECKLFRKLVFKDSAGEARVSNYFVMSVDV